MLGPSVSIQPGGKGANQAVAAARDGALVVMAGAVGRDDLAAPATELLRAANVDLSRVVAADSGTGCAAIAVDPAGENAIVVGSGANFAVRHQQIEDSLLTPDTTLVLQMEVPAEETAALIRRAHARGTRIVLNLAPAGALPEDALRKATILVANETETAWLASEARAPDADGHGGNGAPAGDDAKSEHMAVSDASLLHQRFGVQVVRTLGAAGLELASAGGIVPIPAFRIAPVDTTAAGDCFVGVLAAALDRGAALPDALRRASAAAALCCTRHGSQAAIPTATETDAFLARHP